MTPKDIFVDVDSTVLDLMNEETGWIGWYNRNWNDDKKLADFTCYDVTKIVKPECGVKMYEFLEDPTIYQTIPPIPGAVDGVQKLRNSGHHIIYATFTPKGTEGAKGNALERLGLLQSGDDYIEFWSRKGLSKKYLNGDILIDDKYENCVDFYGIGYLFTQPWNEIYGESYPYRVHGWKDAVKRIERDSD